MLSRRWWTQEDLEVEYLNFRCFWYKDNRCPLPSPWKYFPVSSRMVHHDTAVPVRLAETKTDPRHHRTWTRRGWCWVYTASKGSPFNSKSCQQIIALLSIVDILVLDLLPLSAPFNPPTILEARAKKFRFPKRSLCGGCWIEIMRWIVTLAPEIQDTFCGFHDQNYWQRHSQLETHPVLQSSPAICTSGENLGSDLKWRQEKTV